MIMDQDFIYSRINFNTRITIEEVYGGAGRSGKVWLALARQIYCESGPGDYRDIGHFASGAPFLFGMPEKISITHTDHFLAVASMKVGDDCNLSQFDPETMIGIDAERFDRDKARKLRERFLSDEELKIVDPDSVEANVTAWTAKEAMLKASLTPGINWHHDLIIRRLPSEGMPGEGMMRIEGKEYTVKLSTYRSDDFIVTLAHS